jgi:hypothetical protein
MPSTPTRQSKTDRQDLWRIKQLCRYNARVSKKGGMQSASRRKNLNVPK